MKELINQNQSNTKTINSREVAEMINKEHSKLLRDIRNYCTYLNEAKIGLVDYFVESTYKDGKGEIRPCYLLTKLGCDMVANKVTGAKGVVFTAKYVKRFDEMEKQIEKSVLSFQIEDPIERAKAWIREQEQARLLIAEKDEIIEEMSPLASLARERMDKTGTVSLTDMTKTYNFKRGQISTWAKVRGYIHKSITEVNQAGEDYFKCVEDVYGHKGIAIKEEGIRLIDKCIDEIKSSPAKFKMELLEY